MKKLKGLFSIIMGICIVASSTVSVTAANTTDTYFSEYVDTNNKLLTCSTYSFPYTRDPYIKDCSYYATREGKSYIAFRKKTDSSSVYLKVTSSTSNNRNKSKEILLKVVATYDPSGWRGEAKNASLLTGDYLNRDNESYTKQSGFTSWEGGLVNQNYRAYDKWFKVKNYPGEYEIWNSVRDDTPIYNYCALEVTTNSQNNNSLFSGCWSPDCYGSYEIIKK